MAQKFFLNKYLFSYICKIESLSFLISGLTLGLSFYFECRGMRVIKPVDLFAFIVSLITFIFLLIIYLFKKSFSKITNRTRTIASLEHHFCFKNYIIFSFYFISIPTILHFFSLPSIKSNVASICAPYGIIIFYLFILFKRFLINLNCNQVTFLVIHFFSFFILLGHILYRSIDEENPILSVIQLFCSVILNGILLITKYSFHTLKISDLLLVSLIGSFFSTVYFFFSSLLLKKCDLKSFQTLLYQTIKFTKTWPYLSALLRNVIGLNFYFFMVKKKSILIEFIPYVILFSGIPLAILILDEWESIESYEKIMRLLSILLIIIALFVHILSFFKSGERK